jgi:hypothetical protein
MLNSLVCHIYYVQGEAANADGIVFLTGIKTGYRDHMQSLEINNQRLAAQFIQEKYELTVVMFPFQTLK